MPGTGLLLAGEPDRMAAATMQVLRRNVVSLKVLEPWINRIAAAANPLRQHQDRDPYLDSGNAQAFLRALLPPAHAWPADPPQVRPDLILVLVEVLRGTELRTISVRTTPRELACAP